MHVRGGNLGSLKRPSGLTWYLSKYCFPSRIVDSRKIFGMSTSAGEIIYYDNQYSQKYLGWKFL